MRNLIAQQFFTFNIPVTTTPQPINPSMQLTALIDSFDITVPAAAANGVVVGPDGGVTAGPPPTGLELIVGTTTQFKINQEGRQLYELQKPILKIAQAVGCVIEPFEEIPFVCWDLSQIYIVATAAVTVSVAVFKAMYI